MYGLCTESGTFEKYKVDRKPGWPELRTYKMRVIRHSADTLRDALLSDNPPLQKLFEEYTVAERTLLCQAFQADGSIFHPITIHSPSDWIPSHPEPAESFKDFYYKSSRRVPTPKRKTIYVQTIGPFGDDDVRTHRYIGWLKGYCQAFFYGLPVKIQGPIPVSDTGCAFRINDMTQNLQIHAGDLLKYLKQVKPDDALCIVGATMIDLYPRDSWNFVFGTASLTEGVGVFSFARYDDDFYSPRYKGRLKQRVKLADEGYSVFDKSYTPPITSPLLIRSCKTLTHEIGHMFGIHHCQWLQCVMQGSNHLEESDRRPLDLCPVCLRKLQSAIGFKIADRYQALLQWILEMENTFAFGACDQEQPSSPTLIDVFKDHREWLKMCINVLGVGPGH
ncbi:archaemetzincin-2 isoform X1 [Pelobates cultripes]|uniref:Archaemetzincin-2 n=2 Tax=Pelobates cultripes TaxID=61616 RepID=A0AAD1W3B6_PELCU|nr:archaemetzincin-2 isoform X1 [Pelobates cultripes]